MLFQLLLQNPIVGVLVVATLLAAITVHEFAHAFVADRLGDSTPRQQGRLTLNPKAHLDLWGTLLLLFVGFGWGKPVEFNPFNLKHPRRDTALIAFAGPLSNILIVLTCALFLQLMPALSPVLSMFLQLILTINIGLALFNLLPIEPLDGFKIVAGILPSHLALQWYETRKYGLIVLAVFLITGAFSRILDPTIRFLTTFLIG